MIKKKTSRIAIYSVLLSVVLVSFFQNCSKMSLDSVPETLDSKVLTSVDGAEADTMFYTNNRIVYINLAVSTNMLDQMRLSTDSKMTDAENPWQPVQSKVAFDLNNEYAQDGSKDGQKTVYLEFRNSVSDKLANRVLKNVQIFLDTQAPEINGEELLTKGIQGLEFKKSQNVEVKWNMADRVPASGKSSGLDPRGNSRWAYSRSSDCSESALFEKSSWANLGTRTHLKWPTDDGLDVFYICLFAKDRAGNINTFLSQPMTSLWSVLAGENSQGNGSSVNSNKVRFKYPGFLSLLNNGDMIVRDNEFNNWRKIKSAANDPSRLIETMNFPVDMNSAILYDQAGNAYIVGTGGKVYTVKAADPTKAVVLISSTGGIFGGMVIRKYQNTERLVLAHYMNRAVRDTTAEAYMFEIPLSSLQSRSTPMSLADLKASYKIAGNGLIASKTYPIPSGVTLSKNDGLDPKYSVGLPIALTVGDAGELYLSTSYFTATDIGNVGVRKLTQKSDGTFAQELLFVSSASGRQMRYIKKTLRDGKLHEVLLVSGSPPAAFIYDLQARKILKPFTEVNVHDGSGAIIVQNETKTDYSFYITSLTTSQIYHYDSSYKLIEILGRPVYDNVTDPLAAIIGNVDGIVTDNEEGSVYFSDSQNALIRKIDQNGVLSTVAGKLQTRNSKPIYNNEALSDFIYNTSGFEEGFNYPLTADFDSSRNRKVIYAPTVSSRVVHALDLVNNKVQTFLNPATSNIPGVTPVEYVSQGIAFAKGPGDKNVLLLPHRERSSSLRSIRTGYVHLIPVQGLNLWNTDGLYMGDVNNGVETTADKIVSNTSIGLAPNLGTVAIDSQGYVFVGGSRSMKVSSLNTMTPQTRTLSISTLNFAMIEEGTKRHILYFISGSRLMRITIDMTTVFDPSIKSISTAQQLCLPGTVVNVAGQYAIDKDGNLLITDTGNARILKYKIRDAAGNLKWTTTCPAA